jgi:predicted kinase
MKLTEELRAVKDIYPAIADLLEAAAQRIEDQRQWRDAWLKAEGKVELLTSEQNLLRSIRLRRKEKECND